MTNATATDLTVANTIRDQLGGNRFTAMTGAKMFVGDTRSLSFQIGRNPKGVTHVKITLDADDTYTVEFFKFNRRSFELKTLASVSMVCADSLCSVFTAHTGLYTRL